MAKVMAVESLTNGVLRTYGEGEMLGEKIPNVEPFKSIEIKNPCIKLDSGRYVWGFQCWWGPIEKMQAKLGPIIKETIVIEITDEEEILPISEEPKA